MRARQQEQKPKSWFRVDNAWVDEENKNEEVTPVYIYDEIGTSWWGDSTSSAEFIQQIGAIHSSRIELHLNSPGGDIFDGVAIYNALKSHPAKVTVIVDALAASAASFIAQAGDEIIMTKAASMMIHDGSAMAWGPAAVMRDTADLLDKLSNTVAEIYADRAGQSIEFWRNLMIEEVWYNSHEAVAAGLADQIGEDTKEEDDEAAQNKWDFSVFNYAGRRSAPDPFQVRQRIANRLKETAVGQPQNTSGNTPEENDKNPASPEVNPDAQTTEGQAEEVQKERDDNPGAVPPPENKVTTSETGRPVFVVGGERVDDPKVVQSRLDMLENFRNETMRQSRVDFVQQLATDNKIMQPQVETLTNYALELNDKGYEAWRKTWDVAAALPMLAGTHAEGTSNHAGSQTEAVDSRANEIEVRKEIVTQHRLGGMSEEKIMQTSSYKRLIELDPTFKL